MIHLRVQPVGVKDAIRDLGDIRTVRLPSGVRTGLQDIAREVYAGAFKNLSGPGRRTRTRSRQIRRHGASYKKTRSRGQADSLGARPGSYPVPVLSGQLRRLLDLVLPGGSRSAGGKTFRAGHDEAVVFDAAEYAGIIHNGTGSSDKYGPREYIADAVMGTAGTPIMGAAIDGAIA